MSKGGSTSTSVEVPEYIEEAAKRNLNRAEGIANLGYVPYYGPDVAALTPLQEASMRNTAGAAGAFGLAGSGDPMAGMPEAQTFAGGVRGYSSAPLYEQSLQELQQRRPGQYDYMQSFFIDPVTGLPGSRVADPIDYTQPVDGGGGGGDGGGDGAAIVTPTPVPDYTYNGETYAGGSQAGQIITNPASPSITDTSSANLGQAIGSDIQQAIIGGTMGRLDPSYQVGAINNPIQFPTVNEMVEAAPTGMSYNPQTGGYQRDDDSPRPGEMFGGTPIDQVQTSEGTVNVYSPTESTLRPQLRGSTPVSEPQTPVQDAFQSVTTDADLPGNVLTRTLNIGAGRRDDSSDSGYAGEADDGCVIATHAVSSGGFTPSMKREAVVWCMNVLHDKWWGEAIRRGYRHLGRKKIEQGKAHEHYAEFRDYIAFANGKKRTLKGAIKFSLRTAQFFAVGIVKKDA